MTNTDRIFLDGFHMGSLQSKRFYIAEGSQVVKKLNWNISQVLGLSKKRKIEAQNQGLINTLKNNC